MDSNMEKRVLDERLRQIFFELTSIDATSGKESAVADYIIRFVNNLGLKSYRDNAEELSGGNSGNVIVEILGGGEYLLASHMDTPRSTAGLKHQFKDDRITSDGTTPLGVDDRGGLSSILFALEKAVENKALKPCTLLFTVCEETTLAGSLFFKPAPNLKYGFIFDSYMTPGHFVTRTCGAINFELIIKGKSSHAGISPEKGINAIMVSAEAMTKFPFGRIDEVTTANIGSVNGGTNTNVVCDEVVLKGELRTDFVSHGEELMGKILADFTDVCKKYGASMESKYFWDFLPYNITDGDLPFIHFSQVAENLGIDAVPAKSMGGSDANSLNAKGIKTINLGVGAQNPHGNDEFILYEDLSNASKIAYQLLTIEIKK
ncbi:MAG: M20/M25/M40 family metallo-hydrolase [Bacteroidales bacterium]|nr:M20/M25/M40 family metallo-hydrolase [Bacteroidales bacterium]